MELLNAAAETNYFGLKRRFAWRAVNSTISNLQTDISFEERNYLAEILNQTSRKRSLQIERIENLYLWGRYILQYEEMKVGLTFAHVREQIMIHATTSSNAYSIANENFKWRLVRRSRFGSGVSFTKSAEYADRWASASNVYIVAGILVANSSPGSWGQTIPRGEEDTTTGYTEDVCIKYTDNEFYPYYIVKT